MKMIYLPYDKKTLKVDISDLHIKALLTPQHQKEGSVANESELVKRALEHPIGTKRLSEMAEGKDRVVIITSDHTRAVPSGITMPLLLDEIRKGNPSADITIIIATGLHRGMTREEMIDRFGKEIVEREKIINHDAFEKTQFVNLGTLPSGSKCEINRIAVEADLLVAEGFIEPHFFAGFSGGRKSVLPGIASQECVNINHSAKAIQHPMSATGVLDGNPIHEDMIKAARLAGLACILNVLLDEKKKVSAAFFGDVDEAHRAGCAQLLSSCGVDAAPADIVITSNGGYPLDQNLYQCPKGLDAARACAKEGGVIILVAACSEGLGGENFGRLMLSAPPSQLLESILATPPEKTISEQWCAQRFADALIKYDIILVSQGLERSRVEQMNFIYAGTVEEALDKALALKGKDASVTVIPDGVGVIVRRS